MNIMHFDKDKIKIFAHIQEQLILLEPNASDSDINNFFANIPTCLLENKDDLKVICKMFAIYTRMLFINKKMNSFSLYEKIMPLIKRYLHNESSFFWTIFGGLYYFKLWLFEEGIITIDTIVQSARKANFNSIFEYFLPEIIQYEPELFEKEMKNDSFEYSSEYLQEFRILRKKYFKWIRYSGDFFDPLYSEIETNQLRLSIKKDDVDAFQKILSNQNLSIDSHINESLIENNFRFDYPKTLFEFALDYNSIKILKFLILNNAKCTVMTDYYALSSGNYEIIHYVESKMKDEFQKYSLVNSVSLWLNEVAEYSLNNYSNYFDFLQQKNVDDFDLEIAFNIFLTSFQFLNFSFINSYLIPFIENNPNFIDKYINEIVCITFSDESAFFTKEFLKHPDFNPSFVSVDNHSMLGNAIEQQNLSAVLILLNNPDIDVNAPAMGSFSPLTFACGKFIDLEILKSICNHPKIDVNLIDKKNKVNALTISVACGNNYATKYLLENFPDLHDIAYIQFFCTTLKQHHLMSLKILLKHYLSKNKHETFKNIIEAIKSNFILTFEFKNEFLIDFKQIYDESIDN